METARVACTYAYIISSVRSVSLSWGDHCRPSSPCPPPSKPFLSATKWDLILWPPENEECQLCVYSEIALIKWPRHSSVWSSSSCSSSTVMCRGLITKRFEGNIYRSAPNRRRKEQRSFVFAKIMEGLIIPNYDACDQVIMNFLLGRHLRLPWILLPILIAEFIHVAMHGIPFSQLNIDTPHSAKKTI